jgi:hypothetical protein
MPTQDELYAALRNADASGDHEGAQKLADYIKSQGAAPKMALYKDANGNAVASADPTGHGLQPWTGVSPTDGMSGFEKFRAGYGKGVVDLGRGVGQMAGITSRQDVADARQLDAPLMATGAGSVGDIAGTVATALPAAFVPGANTYVGAAAVGGVMGAAQPVAGDESRLLNTGVGAGLGVVGKYGADKLGAWLQAKRAALPPVGTALNGAEQQAAANGQNLGFRLTPGQQSGSPALQKLEAKMESQPWMSGPIDNLKAGNQSTLNTIASKAIGESSNTVDASVLGNASERLGGVFDSVRNPNSVVSVDPKATASVIDGLESGLDGLLPNGAKLRDNGLVRNLETLTSQGSINGEQLGQLSSKLGRAAYKNMSTQGGDRDLGQALFSVKDHVDDMLASTLDGDQLSAYNSARGQYRSLMQLTSRVGTTNPSSGNVSGGALANYLQQTDRGGYLFGKNQSDLYNAARFSQAFKPIVGNSGTATRQPMSLTDMGLAIPGNIASRLYLSKGGSALARGVAAGGDSIGRGALIGANAVSPAIRFGLPGVNATLVPYLTQ